MPKSQHFETNLGRHGAIRVPAHTVKCCIGGDAPVPDMSITRMQPLLEGDVLLACSDGLWSGISDVKMSKLATRKGTTMAENLKALSMAALSANAPYSDNTTGTALRWFGD